MRHLVFGIGFFCSLLLISCEEDQGQDGAVARVNDRYLLEEDIVEKFPSNLSAEDSILFRKNFIEQWAMKELLLEKAKLNVSDQEGEIDQLVNDYRRALLIERYKRALLQQELDTTLTSEDIYAYYELNKNVYRLNEELLRLSYIHFDLELPDRKEIIKRFKAAKEEDLDYFSEHELEYFSSSLNDSLWVSRKAAEQRIPFLKEEKGLKKGQFLQKEDSLGVYLVAVKEVLRRNDIAPKSYVVPSIRQMILHKRKLELMNQIESTLVKEAINNKQFEQY